MKQLSGLDASFLNIETPTTFGHVCSMLVLDPSTGGGDVYADLKRTFEERWHLLDVYKRKLAPVPLGLDHPYWVDDPDIDLEYHLREIAIPSPGDDHQLGEQVARIIARPLDRTRPLWEYYVLSGLKDGRVALLTKIHHSTIDGASGVELLNLLLDTQREGRPIDPPTKIRPPERTPAPIELLGRTLIEYTTFPRKAIRLQLRLLRTAATLGGNRPFRQMALAMTPGLNRLGLVDRNPALDEPRLPNRPAPRTPFNGTITPHRRFAFTTLSLSAVRSVKKTFDVTVNDVVMSLCAGAVRRYLLDHDALPDDPLIAMVPVSVRVPGKGDTFSNMVTGVIAPIHTTIGDPVDRLLAVHESMVAAKELQQAVPADILTDITEFAPPTLFSQAARLASRIRIVDRLRPPVNLLISNVPGPRQPLYLSGSTMEHFVPVSTVSDGIGLNMTVQSYLDNLDFGLVACRELVPDLWNMTDHLHAELADLVAAAEAESGDVVDLTLEEGAGAEPPVAVHAEAPRPVRRV